jgi:aldehyde dehydrogenase (NAD+)
VVGEWADIGAVGVARAVADAASLRTQWGNATGFDRGQVLQTAAERMQADADDLANLVMREVGKPITEARAEVERSIRILRYYAQAALDPDGETFPSSDPGSWLIVRRSPVGVVALITPWNFPVAIPIWKAAPALAWGNVVVHKPASFAMATALRIAGYFDHAPGIYRVVVTGGDGARALTVTGGLGAISFTGSGIVARELALACAQHGIPFQSEMGGNNASVVLPDADVSLAADTIARSAMAYAGQKCTATQRVIVVGDQRAFTDAFVAAVRRLPVGDPADERTVVGPVITPEDGARILEAVQDAVAHGSTILSGGTRLDADGCVIAPTIAELFDRSADMANEEVFGPVCALINAKSVAEGLAIANETPYGLVASVFTRDLGVAMDLAPKLHVGLVRINAPTTGVDYHVPFGGAKGSSHGPREQGRAAREFFTSTQTMTLRPA